MVDWSIGRLVASYRLHTPKPRAARAGAWCPASAVAAAKQLGRADPCVATLAANLRRVAIHSIRVGCARESGTTDRRRSSSPAGPSLSYVRRRWAFGGSSNDRRGLFYSVTRVGVLTVGAGQSAATSITDFRPRLPCRVIAQALGVENQRAPGASPVPAQCTGGTSVLPMFFGIIIDTDQGRLIYSKAIRNMCIS